MESGQASGYLSWRQPASGIAGNNIGNVTARLGKLIIPPSAVSDVSDILEGKSSGSDIPSVDIIVDNFELLHKKLGHLELLATNQPALSGREWQIQKLQLKNSDAELNATGKWDNRSGEGQTSLSYALEIADAGKLLDRLQFTNLMRSGKGKVEGALTWNGLPFALDVPSLSGQFQLRLEEGQFLKLDTGAAKLLGILGFQSITRRLTLDFSDVFARGLAFDSIVCTTQIQKGVARTDNLKTRSQNLILLIDGSADLVNETQNLRAVVIPEVNVGTASVVYGLAVNPVIGLGTFLAQVFLREPLARAFTDEYAVTGTWKDPVIVKAAHKDAPPAATASKDAPVPTK